MSETMIERVAKAIERVEFGYSIELIRLVDNVSTYRLDYKDGQPPLEFESHEEALNHVVDRKRTRQARAAIEALREPTRDMCEEAAKQHIASPSFAAETWRAMIDAALNETSASPSPPPPQP